MWSTLDTLISVVSVGKLRKVKLRDVWEHEAKDFTPWLAANAELLGEVLGLEVEFTQSEQQVGPYAVDIIGRDLTHNSVLIVENQLEKTNHTHLGQLITYAANTDAVTVVWVAREFTDEHRQAIDYLNELAGDSGVARFYALQVSAVQIDDSAPAALLEVVAQPNEIHASMSNAVKDAVATSGKAAAYRELWRKYFEAVKQRAPELTQYSSPQGTNWQNVNSVKGGLGSIVLVIDKEKIPRVELYIAKYDGGPNYGLYEFLKGKRAHIEREFGRSLVWDEQEHLVSRRIMSRRTKSFELDDVSSHGELIEWLMDEHKKFKKFVLPRVYEYVKQFENE
jgi:hypothetical protein